MSSMLLSSMLNSFSCFLCCLTFFSYDFFSFSIICQVCQILSHFKFTLNLIVTRLKEFIFRALFDFVFLVRYNCLIFITRRLLKVLRLISHSLNLIVLHLILFLMTGRYVQRAIWKNTESARFLARQWFANRVSYLINKPLILK